MNHPDLVRLALVTAITAALPQMVWATSSTGSAATAQADTQTEAQTSSPPASKRAPKAELKDVKSLQAVVVTANVGGVKKIDASYNIVAADRQQITEANPKSTADLLKISPGIWPESSGGQTGANIEIAGFPGGGDAPFPPTPDELATGLNADFFVAKSTDGGCTYSSAALVSGASPAIFDDKDAITAEDRKSTRLNSS